MKKPPLKQHPKLKEIEAELIKGTPYTQLAATYNTSSTALSKYKNKYLARKVSTYKHKTDLREGDALVKLAERYIGNVDMIAEACIEQLKDPDNPEKLFIGVQADEIDVTYYDEGTDGQEIKRKEKLQTLLDKLERRAMRIEINTPDRVHTLLQASHAMNKHIHLIATLVGSISNTSINVTNQPVFIELTQNIIQALEPYPEARQKVAEHIRGLALEDRTID
ncbi:hypothetical protein KAR91_69845 [Candidatus Pacearchaeota archaeon]|nr:hypothetical protein [Candidatus Pacearchaeota archaeon]